MLSTTREAGKPLCVFHKSRYIPDGVYEIGVVHNTHWKIDFKWYFRVKDNTVIQLEGFDKKTRSIDLPFHERNSWYEYHDSFEVETEYLIAQAIEKKLGFNPFEIKLEEDSYLELDI